MHLYNFRCCGECSWLGVCRMLLLRSIRRSSWLGVRRMLRSSSIRRTPSQLHSLQQIPTQHDMLPQHVVYKNELNREHVITLARNDETP